MLGTVRSNGFRDPSMLLASHIKPWSRLANAERLDKYNGLLLVLNLDTAFDQGFISFSESGSILIAETLSEPAAPGIRESMGVELQAEYQPYMDVHRNYVFEAS